MGGGEEVIFIKMPVRFRWERDFRDTEIGRIPRDWEVRRLSNICKISSGKRPNIVNKIYGQYELWGANGLMGFTNDFMRTGEIIITGRVGTLGNVFYIPKNQKIWVSDNALILNFTDKVVSRFLYYHLQTRKEDIENLNVGSTQPLLTQRELKTLNIPLPPSPEQSRIATVLSWFDELIDVKKKQNEILEKTAMAMFKSWFIDFEPFKDEEFIYSEELGREIPKGWEVKRLGNITKIKYGKGLPKEKRKLGNYPVVGSSGIDGHHKEFLTKAPAVVIGRKGNVGSVYLIMEPCYPIDTVFYIPPEISEDLIIYTYHFLKSYPLEDLASSDTAVPGLNLSILNSLNILLPPSPILQKFHSLVQPLFEKIINNQKEIMILKKVRDTLLPLLVFGKLRVEEV